MPGKSDELLAIFWVEAAEYLEQLNTLLLQLEVAAPGDDQRATLREVSRIAHSLKGAARTVGQTTIERLAHKMEDLFDAALAGQLALEPAVADALYDSLDVIGALSSGEAVDEEIVANLVAAMQAFVEGDPSGGNHRSALALAEDLLDEANDDEDYEDPDLAAAPDETLAAPLDDALPGGGSLGGDSPGGDSPGGGSLRKTQTSLIAPSPLSPVETLELPPLRPGDDVVRVSVSKLDQLMDRTSDLLVARMRSDQYRDQVRHLLAEHHKWQRAWRQVRTAYIRAVRRLRQHRDDKLSEAQQDIDHLLGFLELTQQHMSQTRRELVALNRELTRGALHLSTLVDELQGDIASARMLPFETILGGFQRMVRDLARETGKAIDFVVQGGEVELDKHVLESLKDPLMHLLRNAIDHGIEPPERRIAAGKPARGTVGLVIAQRGNHIEVSIADDGRGIDPARVRERAIANQVISSVEADAMTTSEIAALIFVPRFSTAEAVTTVSGRGVGLDVVQQRVEALRGRLWLENTPGQGAVFHLLVPVSLTRIHCLLARAGAETYALPLNAVVRIMTLDPDAVFMVDRRPMIRVLGRAAPLVHLGDVLDRPGPHAVTGANTPVLILQVTERMVALAIDELVSEQELVLKKLGREMSRVRNVAGAAILGSSEVVIVLNANDLVKSVRQHGRPAILEGTPTVTDTQEIELRPRRVLVVDDSITTRTLEKNILEAAGYIVRVATDGDEAIQALLEEKFDLIVSDVEMPRKDGFALTREVKNDARWQHIPVLLVTSLDSPADRERGLQAGADAYLVKPRFDQDELLQMVQKMA